MLELAKLPVLLVQKIHLDMVNLEALINKNPRLPSSDLKVSLHPALAKFFQKAPSTDHSVRVRRGLRPCRA